jgi:signal transduction histidine kinase
LENKIENYEKIIRLLKDEINGFQAAVAELKVLNDIAVASGRADNVDETLKLILNKTTIAVNAEYGAILLVSPTQGLVKTFIKQEKNSKVRKRLEIREHITGWVLLNKKSLLVTDLIKEDRFKTTEEERQNIKSLICSPIWFEAKMIGVMHMINKKDKTPFTENDLTLLSIISVQAGQLIKNSELQHLNFEKKQEAEVSRQRAEKAELQAKIMEAEKEINQQKIRTHIASDLHDDLGTSLSRIAIFSQLAKKEAKNRSDKIFELLDKIENSSRGLIDSMNDIVWSINPDNDSLEDAIFKLENFAFELLEAKGMEVSLSIPDDSGKVELPLELRRNLLLIFKEMINNIAKHSSARNVSVKIELLGADTKYDAIKILIEDNGVGFDTSKTNRGNGLKNISKRAQSLNGDFKICSSKGAGARMELFLPLQDHINV